ncbi:MAG TPA: RNA-guided endonuclease TnpB family protein [Ktedonobacterales bacterium]|nr:RNA-guided endonuclease TnpB family protein [Ktedonobacterales bacterium]
MKQTLLVKLAPTPNQHASLLRTLERFNAACNAIAAVAFAERCANKIELQRLIYYDIREQFGLSSQMTIRAISKVSEAYKRDRSKQPHFRPHGAMVYDERILSFPRIDRASLLTLDGRVEVPFRFGAYAEGMLQRTRGQADLLYRNDTFFLAITVDAPESTPTDTDDFLGVDLGIIQLATTSDGAFLNYSAGPKHSHMNQVRARYSRFRAKLQKQGTKSAKRLLRKRSGREKRFAKDVNHCLSKAIVQTAKGTSRGIALEDLQGIRERAKRTVTKRHRRVLHTWSFFQLRAFIAYKAALAGVRVVYVNPAYTSQTCSACGHCEQANRKTQSKFLCTSCGFSAHADVNAAINIGSRAAVNRPDAAALTG